MRALAIAVTFVAAACGRPPEHGISPGLGPDAAAPSGAVAIPTVRVTARATDPLWLRAKDGDAIALTRLADGAGASDLLEGVEDGGAVRKTALLALPHADDADLALGRLGEIALAEDVASAGPVLDAMLGIAHRPRDQREPLDLEGARHAAEALLTIASKTGISPEDRATAISAARALADKGYLDPARIPP